MVESSVPTTAAIVAGWINQELVAAVRLPLLATRSVVVKISLSPARPDGRVGGVRVGG